MSARQMIICESAADLARRAAERVATWAAQAIQETGRFTIALAGGSTPESTYRQLAQQPLLSAVDWKKVFVFFGDERMVPHSGAASNYGMVRRSLLDAVPIPDANVFPVVPDGDAATAAAAYEATMRRFFGPADSIPRFDLVLLGLGDDGHTASLFPGADALAIQDHWVTWSRPGILPPPVDRVTLTFPVLNVARRILFLVSGDKKAEILRDVLRADVDQPLPASRVEPADGEVTWLLDRAAARLLPAEILGTLG